MIWLGYPEATWESGEDLESAGELVQKWMEDAQKRFKAKYRRRADKGQEGELPEPPDFDSSVQGDPDTMADTDADAEADVDVDVDDMDVFDMEEDEAPPNSSAREVKGLHIDMESGGVSGKDSRRAQRARVRRARMGLLAVYQSRSPLEREMEFLFTMSLLS